MRSPSAKKTSNIRSTSESGNFWEKTVIGIATQEGQSALWRHLGRERGHTGLRSKSMVHLQVLIKYALCSNMMVLIASDCG